MLPGKLVTIGFEVDDDDVVVVVVVTGVEVELYVVVMGVVVTVGKTGIVTLVVGIEGIVIGAEIGITGGVIIGVGGGPGMKSPTFIIMGGCCNDWAIPDCLGTFLGNYTGTDCLISTCLGNSNYPSLEFVLWRGGWSTG